ncbi:MAG TPA: SCO2522 family protein [Nocardia sp.]|uniref:SCO2522 family protein n=1 Tax=Nocardia TaxID=1817 RepID=UPI002456FE72|nr:MULTISPECIES: SCO2522 family protein [Nocardia]HLS79456.1 SCO2522 family protein [Nocardia sp.]
MSRTTGYSEATEDTRVENVALSHVSIEVGHFYMDHLLNGEDRIRAQFEEVGAVVEGLTVAARRRFGPAARISTCFLIDDYFRPDPEPGPILDRLLAVAGECGVTIDYLAREAACWEMPICRDGRVSEERVPLAELVAARIVAEPPRNSNGGRPPTSESGWLCNGTRASDSGPAQAMHHTPYVPAEELGKRNHSIFLDVEMWSRQVEQVDGITAATTKWSCPFLAAVWQLLRLGMIRDLGAAVVRPQRWRPGVDVWPQRFREMPGVVQLTADPAPFAAYRSLSVLPHRYLGIEHAVKVILDHVEVDGEIVDQIVGRGQAERVEVPRSVTERISHHLLYGS